MDIKLIREENSNDAILSILLRFEDIRESAEKSLHTAKQKMNLPGFRKGKIPTQVAKNYIWEGVIKDEIEKKLEQSIKEYFKTNEIEILKPVLPIESKAEIDLKNYSEHDFQYQIGIIDKLDFEPSTLLTGIKLYQVKINENDIDVEIEKIRHTYGEYLNPETIDDQDELSIYLEFTELTTENEIMEAGLAQKISKKLTELPDNFRKILIGKQKDETIDVLMDDLFSTREELAEFLKIEKLAAEDLSPNFRIKIISIHLHKIAELNESLFTRFTEGKAKTYEDFRSQITELMNDTYKRNSENRIYEDIHQMILNNLELKLPEKFVTTLFEKEHEHHDHKETQTEEALNIEKENFKKQVKWAVIIDYLANKYAIEVVEQDILRETYYYISSYYMQYGIRDIKPDEMTKQIKEYLKNQDNVMMMKERFTSSKVLEKTKSVLTFDETEITLDDFKKLNNN